MSRRDTNYKQGHSASTVSNHALRTVDTDAAFVLPHLRPTDRILDIGCGPGSITVGLAQRVPQGSVVGVDLSASVLDLARQRAAAAAVENVTFETGDVLSGLPFAEGEFDVLFSSQLFPHLQGEDVLRALREMRRVLRSGGLLATRDAAEVRFYPARLGMDRVVTERMLRGLGSAKNWPGGDMPAALRGVGFEVDADGSGPAAVGRKTRIGLGTTVHFGPEARGRLADGFLGRLAEGDDYCRAWREAGIREAEIEEAREALRMWKGTEDAWYLAVNTEILAWK